MRYYERFFAENPDPDNWDGELYIGNKFYALVKINNKGKIFYHALLTDDQRSTFDKAAKLTSTEAKVQKLEKERLIGVSMKKVSERTTAMKKPNGFLLHVFGPGRSPDPKEHKDAEEADALHSEGEKEK